MKYIDLTEDFRTNVALMDEEHALMGEIINELHDALYTNRDMMSIVHLFDKLVEVTERHFNSEEQIMIRNSYSEMDVHRSEHNRLLTEIKKFQGEFDHLKAHLTGSNMLYLKLWLLDHIELHDKKLGVFVNQYAKNDMALHPVHIPHLNVGKIQAAIREFGGDGWLFCDFQNRDKIAYRMLGLDSQHMTTRRWFYFIPAKGEPVRLVHRIESGRLDLIPGAKMAYSGWKELQEKLQSILQGSKNIFMQYSPMNNIPQVSMVDGGTLDLIRSFGVEVISSKDLIQRFLSCLDETAEELFKLAGEKMHLIRMEAFQYIFDKVRAGERITEREAQLYIVRRMEEEGMTCEDEYPIVAVNANAADPHYQPTETVTSDIVEGDNLLIDMWAKMDHKKGIYYDITWCGFVGFNPSKEYVEIFEIAVGARKAGRAFIDEKLANGEELCGWMVDDVCRKYIDDSGYGVNFVHRTGHSIDVDVHGSGANIDNLETKDDRALIPRICFSLEPGIYLPNDQMGVRTEVSVFIDNQKKTQIFGPEQEHLLTYADFYDDRLLD